MAHLNLTAYNGYEKFETAEAEEAYREAKLAELDSFVDWVRGTFSKPIRVLDLGSGNLKWLVRLEREGLLEHGLGLEVSRDRHEFAERWVRDWGLSRARSRCENLLEAAFKGPWDLCLATDIILQFLNPIQPGALGSTLSRVHASMAPGGRMLIDLQDLSSIANTRTWQEFDEPDPWRFLLWDAPLDEARNVVSLRKRFIGRSDNRVDFSELELEMISLDALQVLLTETGFSAEMEYLDHHHDPTETRVVAQRA